MIQFGNASVADIKYGSQQADKVYHGSDLVWRRDEWVEYTFPNTTNGVDIKCSSTTGDGSLGFDLKVSTPKKWAKNNAGNIWYPLGNGNGTELTLGFADGGGGTNTFYWACRLPAEWGKAKVKSVNVSRAKNYFAYSIVGGESRSAFDTITTAYNQKLDCTIFSRTGTTDVRAYADYAPTLTTPTDPISVIKVQGSKATQDANGNTSYEKFSAFPGRFTFTFLVSKAGLKEWAANYGVTLPSNIA